ncbi:MAG TPA: contact-dependent growth inhibition system immunity protein [Saprospiraceae bacterium]|nr:contact-dependent growth inhibition system immunity protein [Saprospiraceae bacterium]HPN68789.1 contact-dependent growth inhibition system immunity protein [Saprospiraceae bacterium]
MTKLENNWRQKSLENLEKVYWGHPQYDSHLVIRSHEIRKLPLSELNNDDIAMMIRQQFSLDYLVPLAIEKLEVDPLAFGECGTEGAIMEAILKIDADFWMINEGYWTIVKRILDNYAECWSFKNQNKFEIANPNATK